MSRKRKTRKSGPGQTPEQALAQQLAKDLIAAHGGDTIAAWQSVERQGGFASLLQGCPGPGLAADGSVAGGQAAAAPTPTFTLPEAPADVSTYTIRAEIADSDPTIWRRLEVAGDLTLEQLHIVLQGAFGWFDYHLHAFVPQVDGVIDQRVRPFPNEGTDEFCDDASPHESLVRLDQVVARVGDQLSYEYDFGDSWHHLLTVEAVGARAPGDPRARCVDGGRAGPPEDVGGIDYYNAVVAALEGGPEHELAGQGPGGHGLAVEDLEQFRQWVGEDFDPAEAHLEDLRLDEMLDAIERAVALSAALVGNPRLCPAFAELVERCEPAGALPALGALTAASGLDLVSEAPDAVRTAVMSGFTREEAEAVVAPWQRFVAMIGPDGAELTAAGNLRPTFVAEVFEGFGMVSDWGGEGGKTLREDQTPVADLREAATRLGLVRKSRGRLLPTKAGSTTDPVRLWRVIADHLSRGSHEYERQAAVLALLVAAADPPAPTARGEAHETERTDAVFRVVASETLTTLGWRSGHRPPSGADAMTWSRTVWTALELSGCLDDEGHVTPSGQRLARAALLAP